MKRSNAGFTLIEVLIAIVVLGLIVMPICSSLVMSVRINAKAESILEAKLAVSSAVETMMATGLKSEADPNLDGVDTVIEKVTDEPYYKVIVTSEEATSVSVETYIRAVEETTPEGGGTE